MIQATREADHAELLQEVLDRFKALPTELQMKVVEAVWLLLGVYDTADTMGVMLLQDGRRLQVIHLGGSQEKVTTMVASASQALIARDSSTLPPNKRYN